MHLAFSTYEKRGSFVHDLDARVKAALLAVYSACLFLIDTWAGMVGAMLLFLVTLIASKVPLKRMLMLAIPVYVLMAFAVLFNACVFASPAMMESPATAGIYPLVGAFSFTAQGFAHGCFMALRILLLVLAALMVAFTTTSTEITDALYRLLSPLKALKVPVEDVTTMFSIALRFIPITAEEFNRVRDAQWSRGSRFGEGPLLQRLRAWRSVLIPVTAGLFRRADALAEAMDARGYSMQGATRAPFSRHVLSAADIITLLVGIILCLTIGAIF